MSKDKTGRYRALLIDLDGTLLDIDLEKFIPAYTEVLARRFTDFIDKEDFIRHLFGATNAMVQDNNPHKKNRTVFMEDFSRRTGQPCERIERIIEDFYRRDFPALSCWGREVPHARPVVELAREKGLTLVLATNPIFPETAVLERLSWSGLSEDFFDLITTTDNMHFCKPKPEYYLEISRLINCPPENCLMAGNDTVEDLSASLTGMETFLVDDFMLHRSSEEPLCSYRGSLKDLAEFIENLP